MPNLIHALGQRCMGLLINDKYVSIIQMQMTAIVINYGISPEFVPIQRCLFISIHSLAQILGPPQRVHKYSNERSAVTCYS